jgi:DNA-directed RNA polymerase specialized sigma24 family protein
LLLEKKQKGGAAMTQEQLLRQLAYCKSRWNGWGEDVFQEACVIALERYKSLNNVNQALFQLLCREAARRILKHRNFEITFSQLQSYFDDDKEEDDFENMIADPRPPDVCDACDACDDAYDDDFISFADKEQLQEKSFQLTLF